MSIGDWFRLFIIPKFDKIPGIESEGQGLTMIYEIELVNIIEEDGFPKHPAETVQFVPRTEESDFMGKTKLLYNFATDKAKIRLEREPFDWSVLVDLMELFVGDEDCN